MQFARGPVAQLGARFHGMEEVVGSIPTRSTILPKKLSAYYPLGVTQSFLSAQLKYLQRRPVAHHRLRRIALQHHPQDLVIKPVVGTIGSA